ncbi:L,D-transpeptidase [Pelagibius sp. Alg239-R121]|uniref:L,D-transpeptidase family protein n=1 Tax=Pelagibius sp. Alg239-R121 TaxID=2993448 RepID=UPI0024A6C41A|nr:L,D-transpeptidase family protein [Pelagibius sp. Alg239-R121]
MDLIVEESKLGLQARFGDRTFRCAVGRTNFIPADQKREGDGATPIGRWRMCRVLYRPDRVDKVETRLPLAEVTPKDGWCDAPEDPLYNQQIVLPYSSNHEVLWRDDQLYDVIVVLAHNSEPIEPGRGSAIFLHVARDGYKPTEGCVALARQDLLEVLREADSEAAVVVAPRGGTV